MVNASWHPNRATCAVSVGRSVYLVDGATGAVLRVARTPLATLALAHAPAKHGARLCALLRDGSLHAVDFEDQTRADADAARSPSGTSRGGVGGVPVRQLHPPTVNVKKCGLAPTDRRGLICFGGDAAVPWAVFALAGDVALRAARVLGGGEPGDPGSLESPTTASSAPSSGSDFASSSRSGGSSVPTASSFGSALFGKKSKLFVPLLRIKGEYTKPLACVCGGGEGSGGDETLIYAGYVDGAVFCYDLRTQTCVGSASLPRAAVAKNGDYASTDDAADPLGIETADEDDFGEPNDAETTPPTNDDTASVSVARGPSDGDGARTRTTTTDASTTARATRRRATTKKTKNGPRTVRSKAPPPCTAMALVARGGDAVLVVADLAGRLTSWSAPSRAPSRATRPGTPGFGSDARATEPAKTKRRSAGPGGAPALERLSGARASDSNAPVFALGALPDGRGVVALAGERDRVAGVSRARCLLKTFRVSAPRGTFVAVGADARRSRSPRNHPFPPLPPASPRVALASHPTQTRVAVVAAAADASAIAGRGGGVRAASDAPSCAAFFAVADGGFATDARDALALRDRVETEHVSTAATAAATPPPRRARVFFLGDSAGVWSVAFAEGPRASRRRGLPPPPRGAEGAVPVRLRVAVTAGDDAASASRAPRALVMGTGARPDAKELFLTLWRVPGAEHCAAACVVDGVTGASVARADARDAVFVTTGGGMGGREKLCLAALARDGASVWACPIGAAATTASSAAREYSLRSLFARGTTTRGISSTSLDDARDASASPSVTAYRVFPGPERGSVAAACLVDARASVFAAFHLFDDGEAIVAPLERGERVLDAAWQLVGIGDGAEDATPWGGLALLTTRRLLLYEYALAHDGGDAGDRCALTKRAEVASRDDFGARSAIASFLWVGPALLFARADGVSVLGWDGRVSLACACGIGGGAELALSAATEDALLLFLDAAGDGSDAADGADFPRAVPFFRPFAAADALAIGWGSLIAAKTARDGGVAEGVALVARRAAASAFARHDASRVSPAALAHVASSLALPGLAANVASRAAHLRADERARYPVERASAGDRVPLGSCATPASVFETETAAGAPTRETSRVASSTRADALGRRVAGSAPFSGGVEGDCFAAGETERASRGRDRRAGDANDDAEATRGGRGRRPEPPVVPTDPPPHFRAASGTDHFSRRGGSQTSQTSIDPFAVAAREEEDDDPFGGDGAGARGAGAVAGDPFASEDVFGSETRGGSAVAFSPLGPAAFASGSAPVSDPVARGNAGRGRPGFASFGALPDPGAGAGADPFGSEPPSPEPRRAPDATPFAAFAVSGGERGGLGDRTGSPRSPGSASGEAFGSGFGGSDRRAVPARRDATPFEPFDAPFVLGGDDARGAPGFPPRAAPDGGTDLGTPNRPADPFAAFVASAPPPPPRAAADAPAAMGLDASRRPSPTLARASASNARRGATDARDQDDPFGAASDEDPFSEAEEEEAAEEEARRDASRVESAATSVRRRPRAASPAPRPRVARAANRTHVETLRWASRGIDALEKSDYETCELAFKAATKLAVAGHAPSVHAAAKCRAYAVAARALRLARAVSLTVETDARDASVARDADLRDASVTRDARERSRFVPSKGRNLSAARELARLARHLAALPLDAKHRACACRFAAVWHFRLGARALGGEYLAAAAAATAYAAQFEGEEGARARAALAPLARCARAAARGAKPGGPFLVGDVASDEGEARAFSADPAEVAGWVCAATLRSLSARDSRADRSDDAGLAATEGGAAVECARCRAAHCEAFARGDNATCAVCDAPFRLVSVATTGSVDERRRSGA